MDKKHSKKSPKGGGNKSKLLSPSLSKTFNKLSTKQHSPKKLKTKLGNSSVEPKIEKKIEPKNEKKKHKINIFLDLDQTLLSAESLQKDEDDEDDDEIIYDIEANKRKARKFNYKNMEGYFVIFERPYLQEFLDYLFANFNISVWTAASRIYCIFVIEHLLLRGKTEKRHLDNVLYSYHGKKQTKLKKGMKNLSMLWDLYHLPNVNENNTIILDDHPDVHKTNSLNSILVPAFNFFDKNSENDDYLKNLIPKLETLRKEASKGGDIKKIIQSINNNLKT